MSTEEEYMEEIYDEGIIPRKIRKALDDLYEEIKHGDKEHQKWLKDKIEEFKNKI